MPNSGVSQEVSIPVSIADLPSHDFSASRQTLVEEIVFELETHPQIPGVIVLEQGRFSGIITRLKLFERLAHRFGVELFLRKPIANLRDLIRTASTVLPASLPVDEAVQYALGRNPMDVYDPVAFLDSDEKIKLIDINLLLMAQSRAVASLSNVFVNLEQIDQMIVKERSRKDVFTKLLGVLHQVVPYHQAAILVAETKGLAFSAFSGYRKAPPEANGIRESQLYKLMINYRQPIYLPRAREVPAWRGLEALGAPSSWLGIPLFGDDRLFGLLSISRNVDRVFTTMERDTALAFGQRIVDQLRQEELTAHLHLAKENQRYSTLKSVSSGANFAASQFGTYDSNLLYHAHS